MVVGNEWDDLVRLIDTASMRGDRISVYWSTMVRLLAKMKAEDALLFASQDSWGPETRELGQCTQEIGSIYGGALFRYFLFYFAILSNYEECTVS